MAADVAQIGQTMIYIGQLLLLQFCLVSATHSSCCLYRVLSHGVQSRVVGHGNDITYLLINVS
jgi:hypothetical protein